MRAAVVVLGLSLVTSASGCRQQQVQARLKEYTALLDPQVGKSDKADIVRDLGMPERCEPAREHEFCRFRTSYGHTASAQAYSSDYATASSHEVYDQIDAEFDSDGTFLSWRAYVQR